MKSAVVNLSNPHYNLGAHKIADWASAEYFDGDPGMFLDHDMVYLSAIFSWDVRKALDIVFRLQDHQEVEVGGPGFSRMANWFWRDCGIQPKLGIDNRFEMQRGKYRSTFASRGCPVDCWFCTVPKMEGKTFTLYWDFDPAPILCDNNLSALPIEFQEHIIRRYRESGVELLDANSGFEPATFDVGTYERWREILRGPWRFAFDYMPERSAVKKVCEILSGEKANKKRVYVLIGNESIEDCYRRSQEVIEWGCEPYCQPVLPLDATDRRQFIIRYDWTPEKLSAFTRYYNRFLWRNLSLYDYEVSGRKVFNGRSPSACQP